MQDPAKNKYVFRFSTFALIIILSHSLIFNNFWKSWKPNETQFVWDVNNYYSYLPAVFIHQDLHFNYPVPQPYWLLEAPNGAKVQKGTCGMAIMYLPWFLIGHKISINAGAPLDGYSNHYSEMVHYGSIFYSLLGFFFLQRALSRYFRDGIVALTLLCVFFGTNLFYYTLAEGEMTHGYLFCLFSALIWHIIRWHETFKLRFAIYIGLLMGLITLIRPTEALVALLFVLYDVRSFASFKEKIRLLLSKWPHLLIIGFCAILVLAPQLIYWKWLTGNFFFFSYGSDERFFWGDPYIGHVLFSWRKGWLLYTPIMIFAVIGLFFGKRYIPRLNFSFKLYFILNLYIISSWWCWWYGGGFGMRALVQSYCFFAFFFAAGMDRIFSLQWKIRPLSLALKCFTAICLCLMISLNLIQCYQYNQRLIHFEGMTKEAYWITFCKFEHDSNDAQRFWNALRPMDHAKARAGIRDQ